MRNISVHFGETHIKLLLDVDSRFDLESSEIPFKKFEEDFYPFLDSESGRERLLVPTENGELIPVFVDGPGFRTLIRDVLKRISAIKSVDPLKHLNSDARAC